MTLNSRIVVFGLMHIALAATAIGQTREVMQHGINSITVTTYAPRDLTDDKLPVSMLKEDWNTGQEVRWDMTAVFALLAEQFYSDDDETLDFLIRGMGFDKWVAIKNHTMAAHVVSGNGVTVVIFRGTNFTEIPDWYKNLSVAFVTTRQGRFHSGFTDAYKMVKNEVHRFIDKSKTDKLWISGHSLGGAMAVACGIDFTLNSNLEPQLVTFGQPRYADSAGAQWIDQHFNGRYIRFVRGDDIVPSVPFTLPRFFPYAHAGRLVAIHDNGVNIANSVMALPALTATYCGNCGRATMNAQVEVYQPSIEPPPLTQQEYLDSLRIEKAIVASSSMGPATVQFIPHYFSDHSMTGYRDLVRRYRDGQARTGN